MPAKKKAAKKAPAKKKTVAKKKATVKKPAAKKKTPIKKKAVAKKVTTQKKTTAKKKTAVKKKAAVKKKPVAKKKAATKKPVATKKATAKKKTAVKSKSLKNTTATNTTKKSTKKVTTKKTTVKKSATKNSMAKQKTAVPAALNKPQPIVKISSKPSPIDNIPYIDTSNQHDDDDYMNKAQKEYFRQILNERKRSLMQEVDRTVGHMKDEAANFPDPADRATQEEEFSLALRTRDRERKLIKKIDEALQRIEEDDYGYCEACGVNIGIKRLEARPTATLCIDCKTVDEIRERQLLA